MTNREIRSWYLREVAKIAKLDEQWAAQGETLERRSYLAWKTRHDLRLEARARMENPDEVALLEARDQAKYGNPDGPTFEQRISTRRVFQTSKHGSPSLNGRGPLMSPLNRLLDPPPPSE